MSRHASRSRFGSPPAPRLLGPGVLVAVLALLLGVFAAPAATAAGQPAPKPGPPVVSPTPRSIHPFSRDVPVSGPVRLVIGAHTDAAALSALTGLITTAGAQPSTGTSADLRGPGLVVLVGGRSEGLAAGDALLGAWHQAGPAGLPSGGYSLAAGYAGPTPVIVLDGVDGTGTFYAVQTLRQLLTRRGGHATVAGTAVRDWPSFPVRGGEESFYGDPWSQADALHQLDFLAAHKMNALLYTPSGDPRTAGAQWRSPYPAAQLAGFTALVSRAKSDHVDFEYRIDPEAQVAPSAGICHSDPADLAALVGRYQQLYDIGERTFSVGWDDDSGLFTCASDTAAFGSDPSPLAAAQASVTTYVYAHFIATHPGARLITVASEYAGDQTSTYRSEFAAGIPAQVGVFWTGPEVVSPTITKADYTAASAAFGGRQLMIFDNYPVNDYATNQQHLGPLTGRDPALAGAAAGIMANEMQQEEPSLIALFTVADYAWNAPAYDPARSWQRSLAELGGPAVAALTVYAANSVDSPLNTGPASPAQPAIAAFLNAYTSGASLRSTAPPLTALLKAAGAAPPVIRAKLPDPAFVGESSPWLNKLADQGAAGADAVTALLAQDRGDRAAVSAARTRLEADLTTVAAIPQVVAPNVYEQLTGFAAQETGRYLSPNPDALTGPPGPQLVGAGVPTSLTYTLVGLAPGTLSGTVHPRVPGGWSASVAPVRVALPSHNRSVQTSITLTVTPPAGFTGAADAGVSLTVDGGPTVRTTTELQVTPIPAGSYAAQVSADSPTGYWRLDGPGGTEADSSGHGLDGHDVDAVTSGAVGALVDDPDTAVTLNGGYVDVPNSPALQLTGPFTVEAWIKPTAIGTQQAVVERYDQPAPNGYILRLGDDGRIQGYVNGPTRSSEAVGSTVLTPGQWHQVVDVYDGSTITVYVDGLPDGSAQVTQPPGAGSDDLRLGARGDDTADRLNGGLDEVAVYSHALTPAEVQSHYLSARR